LTERNASYGVLLAGISGRIDVAGLACRFYNRRMKTIPIPKDLERKIIQGAATIQGWLQPREIRFLALVALNQNTVGKIVELGFYEGKSTSVLASTLRLKKQQGGSADTCHMVTVDPIDATALRANLSRLSLESYVDVRNQTSTQFVQEWNSPIRFLWHDGANDLATVADDCQNLFPFLTDGAIVAFHDILNTSGERIHVYDDMVLNSPRFDWVGCCGSIGFGRYRTTAICGEKMARKKQALSRKLSLLKKYHSASQPNPKGLEHIKYRLLRSRVAHGEVRRLAAA